MNMKLSWLVASLESILLGKKSSVFFTEMLSLSLKNENNLKIQRKMRYLRETKCRNKNYASERRSAKDFVNFWGKYRLNLSPGVIT